MRFFLLFPALMTIISGMIHYHVPCDESFGKKWNASWVQNPSQELRCRERECEYGPTIFKYKKYDTCCACRSCAVWNGKEVELFLEFVSVLRKSLILPKHSPKDSDVFKLHYTNGRMMKMPSNLCNWDNGVNLKVRYSEQFESVKKIWAKIVIINFENNSINALPDLSCLENLNELRMNNNRLTFISNTSFTSLTHLRTIHFSGNLIAKLDPGILTAVHLNIFEADFSNNKLAEIDVSNMLSLYPFCDIGFESNGITQLVNKADFRLDTTKSYGPGYVLFNNNNLQTFPNLKELFHLDKITDLGHLLNLGFNFKDIPLKCDCHFQQFHSLAGDVLKTVLRNHMNVTCTGPPDLKGKTILQVSADQLICKLPPDSGCPTPECICTDRPSENTLSIDCSIKDKGQWLDNLPDIPQSKFSTSITLDISGHSISDISNISHRQNITLLNASNNNILEINDDVAKALENATVDLSNNKNLRQLPKAFLQYRNVCTTYMKNLVIDCNCSTLWIETWLDSPVCNLEEQMFNFKCQLPDGTIKPAFDFTSTDVDCSIPEYLPFVLTGVTVFLILMSTMIYKLRYELLVIYIRLKQADRWKVLSQYRYDIFLSFNDADENVTEWVDSTLVDNLNAVGYRVFQSGQDVTFGAERNSEVLETICKTCNFLLILSDSYLEQDNDEMRPWTENEWKYGWHNFLRDKYKNLIIINFDHVSSFDVNQPQIKAFLRVGCTIDFKNHNRKIMKDICKKLGKPFHPQMKYVRGLKNMKPKLPENLSFNLHHACKQVCDDEQQCFQSIFTLSEQQTQSKSSIQNLTERSDKQLTNIVAYRNDTKYPNNQEGVKILLNMNMTDIERNLSADTCSNFYGSEENFLKDCRSETKSLRTTSIGCSTVSFHSDDLNDNCLTEIGDP